MNRNSQPWAFSEVSLEKSYLWSLAITILPVLSSFVVSWVIARWAGPGVLGTVSWIMAFATACLIVAKFGIGVAASRQASEYGVKRPELLEPLFRVGLGLRLCFTVPVSLSVFLLSSRIAEFFDTPALSGPIKIGALVIFCASIYEYGEHFLVGLNRLSTVYKIRLYYHVLRIAATVSIVSAGMGAAFILFGYCGAWLLAIVLYCVLLFRYLPRAGGATDGSSGLARALISLSFPLAVSTASVALYSQMDKIMLGYFRTMDEVGQYTIARNVIEVSLFPVFASIMVLRPALASRFSIGKLAECRAAMQRSMFFGFIIGVLFSIVLALDGRELVVLVFSDRFAEGGGLLGIFVWILLMRSLGAVILPALVAAGKATSYAYLTFFSATINFLMNLVLIPRFGVRGAVFATIVSYGLLVVPGLCLVARSFGVRIGVGDLAPFLRVASAGVVVWLVAGRIFPEPASTASVLLLPLLVAVFLAGLLFLVGAIRPADVGRFRIR